MSAVKKQLQQQSHDEPDEFITHVEVADDNSTEIKRCLVSCLDKCLRKTNDASAFSLFSMGNGIMLLSNVYLSAALITLAEKEIDCYHADDDIEHDECGNVYGFKPSSLITTIGTITGILSALLVPFIGAIIDCTDHRRRLGVLAALAMIVIQAVQIGTFQSTWLFMSVLQAFNGFLYNIQTLAAYSYLPGIALAVGKTTMVKYTADYAALMSSTQVFYLVLCLIIRAALGLGGDDETTARLGQVVNVVISGLLYYIAWHFFTSVPARRNLKEGESLVTTGFIQVFKTYKGIKEHYSTTLGYFLLGVMFSDAGHRGLALILVTYAREVCKLTDQQLFIMSLLILLSTIPGNYFAKWVMTKTDPITSLQYQMSFMIIFNCMAFMSMAHEAIILPYAYGVVWGCLFGWFYPSEMAAFSMLQPKGQESELTGIFLYSAQILSWMPTLIFTLMNEFGIHMQYGGLFFNFYFFTAIVLFQCMELWHNCLPIIEQANKMLIVENETDDSFKYGNDKDEQEIQ